MNTPSPRVLDALLHGPSMVSGIEWHPEIGSTMERLGELAAGGAPEGYVVLADVQTAGRGRRGRSWTAPPGTSLLCSLLLRPAAERPLRPLLGLLAGVALAGCADAYVPGAAVALKWPNDLLVGGRKGAGVLAEATPDGAVLLGVGVNVDWRGVERPPELAGATSLAEAAGGPVDRWRLLAAFVGLLGNRYEEWGCDPLAFLPGYRRRCSTLGQRVRVTLPAGGAVLDGVAEAVTDAGALAVRDPAGRLHVLHAGDVEHVRPAP